MWIIPKHCCDINQFKCTLDIINKINGIQLNNNLKIDLLKELENAGVFKPRKDGVYDLSTMGHKLDEPHFYGAIYKSNGKLHISPYGLLLLKHWENKLNRSKIFLSMLFSIQFPNPTKKTVTETEIYPFRLILQLLKEDNLNYTLSNIEVSYILYKVKTLKDIIDYNKVLQSIIEFRNKSEIEKIDCLKYDADNFIKSYESCNYAFTLMSDFGVTNTIKNEKFIQIKSPKRKSFTNISLRKIEINNALNNFYTTMLNNYTVIEEVKKGALPSEWTRIVYNFIADELLVELGENQERHIDILKLPRQIIEFSINSKSWSKFEDIMTTSFNVFDDIIAEKIGGPSEPDIVCKYNYEKIFTSDTKSTSKTLGGINIGRIRQHMTRYDAEFSIIITPKYTPGASRDIEGTNICLITSYCFADLINKYAIQKYNYNQECLFKDIYNIVKTNLGTDISNKIYEYIDKNMGVEDIFSKSTA